ncbi:MAG: hypothetical protein JO015_13740 [Verrucomicrobia bacterium]|nr:hypothetical protein [Verrucomicrobiota bacterium]
MGNPPFVLVICSVAAILVVFFLHGLVMRAFSGRRQGRIAKLVDAIVAKLVLVIYVCAGFAALISLVAQFLPDDSSPFPPKRAWSSKKVFSRLLRREKPRAGQPQGALTNAFASIDRDATLLKGIAQTHPIPPDYLHQLSVDAWQVWRHQRYRLPSDEPVLSAAADLRVKSTYASRNPADPFSSILVKATIRDESGGEVQNAEARFCMKGLLPYPDQHRSFDHPGSPAAQQLPPGSYFFWERRADYMLWANRSALSASRQQVDLGINGEPKRDIDLVVR